MNLSSPRTNVASLNEAQRDIVLRGPTSFAEADAIPQDLFAEDLDWDRASGEESIYWVETKLGREVRDLLEAEEQG